MRREARYSPKSSAVGRNRKCLLANEGFPHGTEVRAVDRKHLDRDTANCRSAAQRRSCPLEVLIPPVHARMEESRELPCFRIGSGDVRACAPIAVKASQGEILEDSLASMLTSDDVIDMKRQRVNPGGKLTVLASVPGTRPDFPDNLPVHK